MYFFQEKPSSGNMAVIDLVLGIFKVVTFVYDIVTFPIYGMTSVNWKERTRQNLGNVSNFIELFTTSQLSTAVAWKEKKSKHFVFNKYFCLVLGLLKSKISKKSLKPFEKTRF